jgi:hypothetical protein
VKNSLTESKSSAEDHNCARVVLCPSHFVSLESNFLFHDVISARLTFPFAINAKKNSPARKKFLMFFFSLNRSQLKLFSVISTFIEFVGKPFKQKFENVASHFVKLR